MDQATESLLFPYVTAPRRIALDAVEALTSCPAVARLAVCGSLAPLTGEPRHDGYADVDLLCAVVGEEGAWQAADALHRGLPVRWHGPLPDRPLPSGRLWFLGEAPFHSVDLVLLSPGEFEATLRQGRWGSEGPPRHELLLDRAGVPSPGRPAPPVSDALGFTQAVADAARAMKRYLRGLAPWDDLAGAMRELDAGARALTAPPPGSEPLDLLNEVRTLYYQLMQERARYGGDTRQAHTGGNR